MKRFFLYWLPVLLWMALIYSASGDSKSVQRSDGLLAQFFAWLNISVTSGQLEMLRWFIRKGAHVTEYFILALLWWRALRVGREGWSAKTAAGAFLICFLYACSDEFHQTFVKDRSGSIIDVLIDTLGASIALGLVWALLRRKTKLSSAPS